MNVHQACVVEFWTQAVWSSGEPPSSASSHCLSRTRVTPKTEPSHAYKVSSKNQRLPEGPGPHFTHYLSQELTIG